MLLHIVRSIFIGKGQYLRYLFSHTRPEDWYRIQIKNELIELRKEEEKIAEHQKFDCRNLVEV